MSSFIARVAEARVVSIGLDYKTTVREVLQKKMILRNKRTRIDSMSGYKN